MSGVVEVTVAHVKHPDTRSPIRRWIYYILEKNTVKTDLGWIILDDKTLEKLKYLDKRAREVDGVEGVKIYRIYIPIELYNTIMKQAPRKKTRIRQKEVG